MNEKILTKRKLKRKNEPISKPKENQDLIEEDPINEIEKTDSFELLLRKSVCSSSFFKLKSEQNWDYERSESQLCNYFKLDLERLNAGANCVPINKRHEIDEALFILSDAKYFYNIQTKCLQKYNNYIEKYRKLLKKNKVEEENVNSDSDLTIETSKAVICEEAAPVVQNMDQSNEIQVSSNINTEDDLDELLHLKVSKCAEIIIAEDPLSEAKSAIKTAAAQSTDDLEDWLNDILDN